MKSKSKWKKIEKVMKFINLSKKAATKKNYDIEKIGAKVSNWRVLRNSINFLTKIKCFKNRTLEMPEAKVSFSKHAICDFIFIGIKNEMQNFNICLIKNLTGKEAKCETHKIR